MTDDTLRDISPGTQKKMQNTQYTYIGNMYRDNPLLPNIYKTYKQCDKTGKQ